MEEKKECSELLFYWFFNTRYEENSACVNFSNDLKFNIEILNIKHGLPTKIRIKSNEIENKLPNDFFGKNIRSLNLIIGENGSGKSTIIRNLVSSSLNRYNSPFSYLFIIGDSIYLKNLELEFEGQTGNKLKIGKIEYTIKNPNTDKETFLIKTKLSILEYGSSFEDIEELHFEKGLLKSNSESNFVEDKDFYQDMRLSNLLLTSKNHLSQPNILQRFYPSEILSYRVIQDELLFKFLELHKESFDKRFSNLSYIIKGNDNYKNLVFSMLNTQGSEDNFQGAFLEEILNDNDDSFYEIIIINVFLYILYTTVQNYRSKKTSDNTARNQLQADFAEYTNKSYSDNLLGLFTFCEKSKLINKYYNLQNDVSAYELLLEFNDFYTKELAPHSLRNTFFKIDSPVTKTFDKLIYKHFYSKDILIPPLHKSLLYVSQGEKTILNIFANIYKGLENFKGKSSNHLIILDEPDVGLHPEWQRTFIKQITDFLTNNYPDNTFQILITSHSPILTSDIPALNVKRLHREVKEDGTVALVDLELENETFGANIHSLYKDSFYLQGGLIGEFAKEKINEIVELFSRAINAPRKYKKEVEEKKVEIEDLISLVGDEIVKSKLLQMYHEILGYDSNEVLRNYYKQKMDELK